MKKNQFFTGGHPLITEDFSHLGNGVIESLKGICDGLAFNGENGFVLTGCEVTSETTTSAAWNAGVIVINGEVCNVDAGTATKTVGQYWRWRKYNTTLAIDPQTYADAVTNDVHIETKAALIGVTTLVPLTDVTTSAPTLLDIVCPNFTSTIYVSGWLTAEDAFATPVAWTTILREVSFRRANKVLTLDFNLSGTLASAAETLFVKLPVSYTSSGNFSSVVMVNGVACTAKVSASSDKVSIQGTFSGIVGVQGQIQININ